MNEIKVLIVGGGVAALETTLALRELAGDRVAVTLIAPEPDFVYRPMTVREPFAYADADRHNLAEIAEDLGVTLIVDRLVSVDAAAQTVSLESGPPVPYDALVLAMGGQRYERFSHVTTIDDRRLDDQLHGLVQDVEGEYVHSVAFVIPVRMAWPLPMYELALMTADRASDMGVQGLTLTIVTPEAAPLAVFGDAASAGVSELLADAGIAVEASADATVPSSGEIVIAPGTRRLHADRIVVLPELYGPSVEGLPAALDGFLAVDAFCRVTGVDGVYAVGDAADFPIKHGGLAALQADTAARSIAAAAGAPADRRPYEPELHGLLITGGAPRYLSARIENGRSVDSRISTAPTWSPAAKISAKYLAPYLQERATERATVRS